MCSLSVTGSSRWTDQLTEEQEEGQAKQPGRRGAAPLQPIDRAERPETQAAAAAANPRQPPAIRLPGSSASQLTSWLDYYTRVCKLRCLQIYCDQLIICILFRVYNVYITFYASNREEASWLEEGRAERARGEMVRKGSQKSCEEVEKDRTVGGVGKSHLNTECQHEMHNHTQVNRHRELSS